MNDFDSSAVRRHVAYLRLNGMTWREIEARSNVSHASLFNLWSHRRPVTADVARRIFSVTVPLRRTGWMARAECATERAAVIAQHHGVGHASDLFVQAKPEHGRPAGAMTRDALRLCAECQVLDECLAHALATGEDGIWGGTTARERRAMRRKDNR